MKEKIAIILSSVYTFTYLAGFIYFENIDAIKNVKTDISFLPSQINNSKKN